MLKVAKDIEYQWEAGEVCFDCPCGETNIVLCEGGDTEECKCGRNYQLVHYVAIKE